MLRDFAWRFALPCDTGDSDSPATRAPVGVRVEQAQHVGFVCDVQSLVVTHVDEDSACAKGGVKAGGAMRLAAFGGKSVVGLQYDQVLTLTAVHMSSVRLSGSLIIFRMAANCA